MNKYMTFGIGLLVSGAAMLAVSIPMLALSPNFLGYQYLQANDWKVDLFVQLMALGAMLVPFGLALISKGRKAKPQDSAAEI